MTNAKNKERQGQCKSGEDIIVQRQGVVVVDIMKEILEANTQQPEEIQQSEVTKVGSGIQTGNENGQT